MDLICNKSRPHKDSVAIVCGHAEWFVRVVENGRQNTESYGCETAAETRAKRDRIRLCLKHVERL